MARPPNRTLTAAPLLFVFGCCGGGCAGFAAAPRDPDRPYYVRLPHHIALSPEATPFRFAMVHDVIHERYSRHGPAFYQERGRLARENMAVVHPDSVTAFAAIDDIAVGLDREGQTAEAITLMRDKLKRQQALMRSDEDLYSSYANLGEFLIHQNLQAMLGGDVKARKLFEEGRDLLRKSMEVNPKAHFGQEEWQLVAIEAFLKAGERPKLMRECDLIGNRLDRQVEIRRQPLSIYDDVLEASDIGRPNMPEWGPRSRGEFKDLTATSTNIDSSTRTEVRKLITPIGGESPSSGSKDTKYGRRAPFDEPAMWLVGEWRQGSGPSPHLALCLGEIMLRVGQRYLAWDCFERAGWLAEQFSSKLELQTFLRDHCRSRQMDIEISLAAVEVASLRQRFESELAFGERYQREYQSYAQQKIHAGVALNDPTFFDDFHTSHAPIASKVGGEEWYAGSQKSYGIKNKVNAFWSWGILTGGACLLLVALLENWRSRPRAQLRVTDITPLP